VTKSKKHCPESNAGLPDLEKVVANDIELPRKTNDPLLRARLEQLEQEIIKRAKLNGVI